MYFVHTDMVVSLTIDTHMAYFELLSDLFQGQIIYWKLASNIIACTVVAVNDKKCI